MIGNVEGECVAWCALARQYFFLKLAGNSPKYNTRVIPSGAITGMLVVKTPGCTSLLTDLSADWRPCRSASLSIDSGADLADLAIAANLNGPLLNIQAGDTGGELDPHGASSKSRPELTRAGADQRGALVASRRCSP